MKYNFYSDPGHGWLEVEIQELCNLGIANKISVYSYRQGDKAYLEEDCDATLFCEAKEAKGEEVQLNEINSNYSASPIRNYMRY